MSDISNFVQRGTDTMLGWVQRFTCFTRALHATDHFLQQHFTEIGDTPFWHLWVPKGAEMTSLRGGAPFAPLPAGFRRLLWRYCPNTTNQYASGLVSAIS